MARPQKKGGPKPSITKKKGGFGKKTAQDDFVSKALSRDVFEAAEESDRRKGHDLDEVDNLEYDAGEIDEEDDEEIDSDEAFDESDEERFDGYKFLGSTKSSEKKKALKPSTGEIDLNEDSDEEEDSEDENGEGYMDLSQMLGGDQDKDEASDEEEEEFRGFDDIEDDESDEDEDMELDNQVADLIDSIESKKRRRAGEEEGSIKKRQLKERNESYKESEFNLATREEDDASKKLSLNDLMGTVDDEAAFGTLKSSLEVLAGKGKNLSRRALDAPLPKRVQDRMERTAASATVNEEITKWQPTIKMNREAEHLSFPLRDNNLAPRENKTSAGMAEKFKAETPLEQQIAQALADAGMKDQELEAFEALKLNKLTVEEVAEKRKELRLMRELMFRHEIKNKRLKKIKSKSYRKLQRKEKDKLTSQIADVAEIDHEMEGDDKMDAAANRAEERMSLKHKNTSKWAKRALARGTQDEGTRDAIMEQLRRGEELRRRIDGDQSEDSDEAEENDETYVNNQLSKLNDEIAEDTQPQKGLLSMKFMQDAAKRQLEATKKDVADFEKEWLAADSDEDEEQKEEANHSVVENNPGRMAYGAKAKQIKKAKATEEESDDETGMVTINQAGQIKKISHSAVHKTSTSTPINLKNQSPLADLNNDDSANPWLQADTSRLSKKASKSNKAISEKPKETKKAAKKEKKSPAKSTPAKPTSNIAKSKLAKGDSDSEADDGSDDEDDQMVHNDKVSFSQRELVARAFANDDVVADFEDEKMAEIERDGDQVEDLTLPGWGAWGGSGVKKSKKKKILKVTKGIDAQNRKDAKLAHVIINEKLNKKAEKYRVTSVPFPFKTMEQYERSISQPVGNEWNTRQTFMKMTKPRIITKLGKVIDPLNAPFA
ncbi:small-subunit processome [Mucor mucedo]|uniref:small-subunit processome n=1 Tax=Mucor mucedo TaxID=29922 RepID=UPI00221E7ADA|nr:small-subunit processome [Mucor mucedo]KAI7896985.1 small-subunit processome [Mucor mucedo]